MSEYAKPTNVSNPILDPGFVWRISSVVLGAVALLGIILTAIGQGELLSFGMHFLTFTWTHNIVHVVLAAAAALFGFTSLPGNVVKVFAIVFGIVYLGLGVLGFFAANPVGDVLSLHLGLGTNLVHVLLGALYLASGVTARY